MASTRPSWSARKNPFLLMSKTSTPPISYGPQHHSSLVCNIYYEGLGAVGYWGEMIRCSSSSSDLHLGRGWQVNPAGLSATISLCGWLIGHGPVSSLFELGLNYGPLNIPRWTE